MLPLGFFRKKKETTVRDPNAPHLFGPYSLHELINRGGTAEIWTATDQDGQTYALRRLRGNGTVDKQARKQFIRGCEVLEKIHGHPFIIGFHQHGKFDGVDYTLLERVAGSNLKHLITRNDPILGEFVGNILIDMALALEHMHEKGFIHLDFKPENVLVTVAGDIRLVDFDLAQPLPKLPKRMPSNAGTPAYMAPEQIRHEPLDQRADIFSFGVTAYELLTFRKPFIGETPEAVLRKQLDEKHPITAPREINADIPIAVERIILKSLEHDPEKRFPNTHVLVAQLQQALYVK
ncbi:MAG: serine/threonine protein kinase [Verrucomicrobia bacterium]|nr:serine/threonine protein kinase [Verrucomicrobiota bacterium]